MFDLFKRRPEPLAEDLRAQLAEPFANDPTKRTPFDLAKCSHCGGIHMHACPRVKVLEFAGGTQIARVEFWPDGKWSREHVIWPWEVFTAPAVVPEPDAVPGQPPVAELTSAPSE